MYRKIFIPTEENNTIVFTVPPEWYGKEVEVLIFPVPTEETGDEFTTLAQVCDLFQQK